MGFIQKRIIVDTSLVKISVDLNDLTIKFSIDLITLFSLDGAEADVLYFSNSKWIYIKEEKVLMHVEEFSWNRYDEIEELFSEKQKQLKKEKRKKDEELK